MYRLFFVLILCFVLSSDGYLPRKCIFWRTRSRKTDLNALFRSRRIVKTVEEIPESIVTVTKPAISPPVFSEEKQTTIESEEIPKKRRQQTSPTSQRSELSETGNYWINTDYGKNYTERTQIWNANKHLSSVGEIGVTEKHINSALQLAKSHNYVKVKLSSHKLDSIELAKQYLSAETKESRELSNLVDIYEIRHRGILFRRKVLLPEKVYLTKEERIELRRNNPNMKKRPESVKASRPPPTTTSFPNERRKDTRSPKRRPKV